MLKKKIFLPICLVLSILLFLSGCSYITNAELIKPVKVDSKDIKYQNELMEVDLNIPLVSDLNNKEVEKKINDVFEKEIIGFKDEIEKIAKEDYEYSKKNSDIPYNLHSAISKFEVKYNKNGFLSVPVTLYSYTGGAHGMTIIAPYNFSISDGKNLKLKDLFKENCDYKKILVDEITKQMKDKKGKEEIYYFDEAFETVKNLKDDNPYYITDDGIVVYFGLYEIAPYAAGIQEFNIPYSKLQDCLKYNLNK